MSFFGNLAAARSAKAFGEYNNRLYQQQAAYQREKAAVNLATYNKVKRPLFVKKFLRSDYEQSFRTDLKEFLQMVDEYHVKLTF